MLFLVHLCVSPPANQGTGMMEANEKPPGTGRSLPSIFDGFPPGPLDFATLERRMAYDTEARTLAALDRAFAARRRKQSRPADSDQHHA